MNSKFTAKQKIQLTKKISNLSYNEHCEIYNIIRKDTDRISENNNGIFINLKFIKDKTLEKILEFIKYCKSNELAEIKKKNKGKKIIEDYIIQYENLAENYKEYEKYENGPNSKDIEIEIEDNLNDDDNGEAIKPLKAKKKNINYLYNRKLNISELKDRLMKKCRDYTKKKIEETIHNNLDYELSEDL